ncbi:hypothetical protein ACIQF6_20240 [Kitasatospora sp. NPDC092948]|uniref:hypothetical protein n=1 Tax=Kitasatospora sp. NPDC092948 TaxID=3364088 RepID=UPI00381238CD
MSFARRYLNSLTAEARPATPFRPRLGPEVSWWRRYLASFVGIVPADGTERAAVAPARESRPSTARRRPALATGLDAPTATRRRVRWAPGLVVAAVASVFAGLVLSRPSVDGDPSGSAPPDPPPGQSASPTPSRALPAGCDEALRALRTYRAAAGTAGGSRSVAARQAAVSLLVVSEQADPAIRSTITELSRNFEALSLLPDDATDAGAEQLEAAVTAGSAQLAHQCGVDPSAAP